MIQTMDRLTKLRALLKTQELSALLVTNPLNTFYLSGFRGLSPEERESVLVIAEDSLHLFIPRMYETEAKALKGVKLHILPERTSLLQAPLSWLAKLPGKIGLEADNLTLTEYQALLQTKITFLPTSGLIEDLRQTKDQTELELIKQAVKITDHAFEQIIHFLKPGISEKQVARKLIELMEDQGAEGYSFLPIVASGSGSTLPHYFTSDKKLLENEAVLMDFGAKFKGYCSDLTRVVYLGQASNKFKQAYNLVWQVEEEVCSQIKPGMKAEEVHQLAVKLLGDQAKYFLHGIGHGVGLDIHERLFLRNGITTTLQPGMILTVEPGLYYEEKFGIRVEDYGVVTETGFKVLSHAPKNLLEL